MDFCGPSREVSPGRCGFPFARQVLPHPAGAALGHGAHRAARPEPQAPKAPAPPELRAAARQATGRPRSRDVAIGLSYSCFYPLVFLLSNCLSESYYMTQCFLSLSNWNTKRDGVLHCCYVAQLLSLFAEAQEGTGVHLCLSQKGTRLGCHIAQLCCFFCL